MGPFQKVHGLSQGWGWGLRNDHNGNNFDCQLITYPWLIANWSAVPDYQLISRLSLIAN